MTRVEPSIVPAPRVVPMPMDSPTLGSVQMIHTQGMNGRAQPFTNIQMKATWNHIWSLAELSMSTSYTYTTHLQQTGFVKGPMTCHQMWCGVKRLVTANPTTHAAKSWDL